MQSKIRLILFVTAFTVAFGFLTIAAPLVAASEKVLFSFNAKDGANPFYAGLIFDAAGNLYGTSSAGGDSGANCQLGCGTVFELTPGTNGKWTEKVLHKFNPNGKEGYMPYAGLLLDAAGNLYGTTLVGGNMKAPFNCGGGGCGTVFELTPDSNGEWTEKVLHDFQQVDDGYWPTAGLISDAAGNLYGTTSAGGTSGSGTVFQLKPSAKGTWREKVLYTFTGGDGDKPYAGLAWDTAGNLYGTTYQGTAHGSGGVFQLKRTANGTWTLKVLHSFDAKDGCWPFAGVIFDASGNLYGTTEHCGTLDSGTAFQLKPSSEGRWTETVLHNFNDVGEGGGNPYAGLISDAAGNLYGTTPGNVFELTPGSNGHWVEKVLHNFNGKGDGNAVYGALIFDTAGNLYGTTFAGGAYGYGTVFKIAP